MKAKAFLQVSTGLACLALAYAAGARTARAQSGSHDVAGFTAGGNHAVYVITAGGDVYYRALDGIQFTSDVRYVGNWWDGAPVPNAPESWGKLKARYR